MPRVLLLVAILVLIALAVRSMLRALLELRLGGAATVLRDEEIEEPAEIPDEPYAWIHERMVEAFAGEREGWALEQAARIDARLQADVPEGERLETVVLWTPEAGAFTMPGRYVYLSRRLQERVMNDDQLAFVIAHEIAHQRLGHVARTGELLDRLPPVAREIGADLAAVSALMLRGSEREGDADVHALNLCLAAGYDAHRCISAFDLLEALALDHGDVAGVFGPDAAIQAELDGEPEWLVSLKTWWWERRRGYPSIRERKERLVEAYEQAVATTAETTAETTETG